MDKITKKLHLILLIYFLYESWALYDKFAKEEESINTQIPTLEAQIKTNTKKKNELKKYFEDIEGTKKRIEKVAQEVEALQKKFPDKISDTENLGLLRDIAESINIKNVFLSPGDETLKGFYFSKAYNFKASGTFLQFLIFLEKVSKSERILNIRNIDLVKSNEKQKGRFQLINAEIVIEAYRYNPNYKENRGYDEIEKQFQQKSRKTRTKKKKKT